MALGSEKKSKTRKGTEGKSIKAKDKHADAQETMPCIQSGLTIYCDGACSGNPGPGGYGIIIKGDEGGLLYEMKGGERETTNNRMELMGAIKALENISSSSFVSGLKGSKATIKIVTDSQYLVKGMTEWIYGWRKRGWKNSKKEPVKNKDLWMRLIRLTKLFEIKWTWVKGHVGHVENERCDYLARRYIKSLTATKK